MSAPQRNRLLVVEDDQRIGSELVQLLEESDYDVECVGSVQRARLALEKPFDLVVLDLSLPDGDGFEICREIADRDIETSIVVLTARDAPSQKVRGLDLGADDYVTKPFHPPELLARIRSVLRRAKRHQRHDVQRVGDLWLDVEARRVGRGHRELSLRPREFELLCFLFASPGRAWTREQLMTRIWGESFDGSMRTVDLYIQRLRQQLETDPGDPQILETVWGVGYRLNEDFPQ